MELKGTNFAIWLLEKYDFTEPDIDVQESIDKYLKKDCIQNTSPEMAIRLTVGRVRHKWSAFRKKMLYKNILISIAYSSSNDEMRTKQFEKNQRINDFMNEARDYYAAWVINHPGIKELWTEINAQYPEKRTAIKQLEEDFMRQV